MTPSTLLIVEDNETNIMVFSDILSVQGYHVLTARTGEESLTVARLTKPNLIIMDLRLPGMNGLDAVRNLKEDPATRSIPVLALTAHATTYHRDMAIEAVCCGYITKPIRSRALRETIESFLPSDGSSSGSAPDVGPEGAVR